MDGLLTAWHQNGNKWRETNLKEGILHGLCIWYEEDGSEKERTVYKDGEPIDWFLPFARIRFISSSGGFSSHPPNLFSLYVLRYVNRMNWLLGIPVR